MQTIRKLLAFSALAALALGIFAFGIAGPAHADSHTGMAQHETMHVTKNPTCGCCDAWVALARQQGYDVHIMDTDDITAIKVEALVPNNVWACHTAVVEGYVVEGHVPFEALSRLLSARPDIAGIAVPGMPYGSPGMGDDPSARYDVIAFGGEAGAGEVFYRAGL